MVLKLLNRRGVAWASRIVDRAVGKDFGYGWADALRVITDGLGKDVNNEDIRNYLILGFNELCSQARQYMQTDVPAEMWTEARAEMRT